MAGVEAKIPVLFFEEGKKVIAYSPALDLSSCGDSEEQARQRFAEAAMIFLNEITEMGTLSEVLEEYGWHKAPDKDRWFPPVYKGSTEEAVRIPVGG
ncbi:MAG: hypothetical protein MUO17_03150 [Dehalococcoidales bacterium]|jgi:hypothetical protein|nr:hypothetical protein [Dehalococcoidales bacterium]